MTGTTAQSYLEFYAGSVHVIGEWGYYTIPESGLYADSVGFAGTLGTAGATITYGATLASVPHVVATIDDAPAGGSYGCGINVYNIGTTTFDFVGTKDSNGNFALNFWLWR
jgi:hypothetical protein